MHAVLPQPMLPAHAGNDPKVVPLSDQLEKPRSLNHLVALLRQELGSEGGLTSSHVNVDRVQKLMEEYVSTETDWTRYALFDESRAYTRNLVDDGNGQYNLMVLCWTPGKQSPVHDHTNAHCLMKILSGELQETQFNWPKNCAQNFFDQETTETSPCPLTIKSQTTFQRDGVAYISDQIGLHRISNPSMINRAVSLHLYTPPYAAMYGCRTFCEKCGKARRVGKCLYYSIDGVVTKTEVAAETHIPPETNVPAQS